MKLTPDRDGAKVAGLVVGALLGLVLAVSVFTLAACDAFNRESAGVEAMSAAASRRILTSEFSGGSEIDVMKLGAPGRLAGLSVDFVATQSATNTFTLYRVRDGVSSLVYTTMFVNSLYADFGDRVWLKSYDVLAFTNSVTNAAVAAFNME